MKREGRIVLIVIFCLCLITSALTFAADKDIVKLQGIVMTVDAKSNLFIVNERPFAWNKQTAIYNERGLPTTFDRLKERGWVYIEGVPDKGNRTNVAKKIYILPGYVSDKDKHLYSFFE